MAVSIYPDRHGARNANFRGGGFHDCSQCGAKIWVGPDKARKHKHHFCGAACRNAWLSANTRGKKSSYFKGGPLKRRCVVCKSAFIAARAEVNRGRGKYCSRECSHAARRNSIEIRCLVCQKRRQVHSHLAGTAKYCSIKCTHKGNAKMRTARELIQRRLNGRIATLMWYSLDGRKAGCKWERLVGYTLAQLMRHLERKFAPGMTWSNMGKWHIDHKRPRCSFKYDSPSDPEFKACWALRNLQPLWAIDNLRKGSRLNWRAAS